MLRFSGLYKECDSCAYHKADEKLDEEEAK